MLTLAEIDLIPRDVRREFNRRNSRASDVSRRTSVKFSASFVSEGNVALVKASVALGSHSFAIRTAP